MYMYNISTLFLLWNNHGIRNSREEERVSYNISTLGNIATWKSKLSEQTLL